MQLEELEQPNVSEEKKLAEEASVEGSNSYVIESKEDENEGEEQPPGEQREHNKQQVAFSCDVADSFSIHVGVCVCVCRKRSDNLLSK